MMAAATEGFDVLIVGGGVIGLSLAWELAQHDARVCVVDQGSLANEASWAGAGMIPAGAAPSKWRLASAVEQLEGLSQSLQAEWHKKLLDQTGIDNEYRQCGAVQLAFTENEVESLRSNVARWQTLGINCDELDATTLFDLEPALTASAPQFTSAYVLPDEAQIRNPRHLRALVEACHSQGVDLRPNTEVTSFETRYARVARVMTEAGPLEAGQICLTTGCWSGKLARELGIELPVRPIRGQIALLEGPPGLLKRNICVGPRYLVPRRDGHVLIGSTQEDAGFEKATTEQALNELREFAAVVAPETADLPLKSSWSGLRPATPDNQPYLGRVPHLDNAWLATGHFRAGLQLSPATAVVMRAMMLEQQSPIDISSLGLERTKTLA